MVESDAGGSAQAGRQIEVTIHRIEQIAKSVVERAEQDATSSHHGFQNTPVSLSAYGDVPLAQELGEMHRAAHQIFLDTVKGVVEDLKHFQANLLDSARAHQSTDDAAYATLTALGRTYEDYHFRSQRNRVRSTRKHWPHDSHGSDGARTEPETHREHGDGDGRSHPQPEPRGSEGRGYGS